MIIDIRENKYTETIFSYRIHFYFSQMSHRITDALHFFHFLTSQPLHWRCKLVKFCIFSFLFISFCPVSFRVIIRGSIFSFISLFPDFDTIKHKDYKRTDGRTDKLLLFQQPQQQIDGLDIVYHFVNVSSVRQDSK